MLNQLVSMIPKNSWRIRANQNCGIDRLKNESPVPMLSNFEY